MNTLKKQIEMVKIKDFFSLFILILAIPIALIFKMLNHKKRVWLISESKDEARDNGYWLFKYLNENKIDVISIYAINYSSNDYKKVKDLGRTVKYGSYMHWVYYLASNKNISSHKAGKPNAVICYVLEIILNIMNKSYFLQHGITVSDAKWLYYNNTKMKLFICGAKDEYDYILDKFGYPKENVAYTGFARFDNLHNQIVNKKQILVMPTWREWIAEPTSQSNNFDDMTAFTTTEYYLYWSKFLNDSKLHQMLEEEDKELLFYPHRNMQKFLHEFETKCSKIKFVDSRTYDIQSALMDSALLITDYSSVFMDFAYMKKPILFYQFDYVKFRAAHYQEGYYNYNDGLGACYNNCTDLINKLVEYCQHNFDLDEKYKKRIDNFFPLYDQENTRRIVELLLEK